MWPFKANYQLPWHKQTWQGVFRKEAHRRYQSRSEPVDAFPFWEGLIFRSLTPWCTSNCPCFSTADGKQPSGSRAFRVLQLKHKLQKEWCPKWCGYPKFTPISGTYIKWSTCCPCEGFFWILSNRPKSQFSFKSSKKWGGTTFFQWVIFKHHSPQLSVTDFCRLCWLFSWEPHQCRPCQVMMVINNPSIRPYFLGFWHCGVAIINDVTSDSFL